MFSRFFWGLIIGLVFGFLFKPQIQKLLDTLREILKKNSGSNKK